MRRISADREQVLVLPFHGGAATLPHHGCRLGAHMHGECDADAARSKTVSVSARRPQAGHPKNQ